MKRETAQQILEGIRQAELIPIRDRLVRCFPETDFMGTEIDAQGWTYADLIPLFERCLSQLSQVLIQDDISWLSNDFHFKPLDESRSYGLDNRIYALVKVLEAEDWPQVSRLVQWLIEYAVYHGFWHNSDLAKQQVDEVKLASQQRELLHLESELKQLQAQYRIDFEKLKRLGDEMGTFLQDKKNELATIESSVTISVTHRDQINEYLIKAAELHGQLSGKVTEGENLVKRFQETTRDEEKNIAQLRAKTDEQVNTTSDLETKYKDSLAKSLDLQSEIESKRERVNELLGLANDAALSGWFQQRQDVLSKKLKWWTWAVPITAILVLGWAVFVFLCLSPNSGNPFLDLGINVFKTLPAFVLLYFVLRQYSRERLIEEEYAFRAAISKTIKTYSDLLAATDKADNATRNKVLQEVLQQVYAMPRLYAERRRIPLRVRTQDLPELLKQIKELSPLDKK